MALNEGQGIKERVKGGKSPAAFGGTLFKKEG
jgi:hypothetical protein